MELGCYTKDTSVVRLKWQVIYDLSEWEVVVPTAYASPYQLWVEDAYIYIYNDIYIYIIFIHLYVYIYIALLLQLPKKKTNEDKTNATRINLEYHGFKDCDLILLFLLYTFVNVCCHHFPTWWFCPLDRHACFAVPVWNSLYLCIHTFSFKKLYFITQL